MATAILEPEVPVDAKTLRMDDRDMQRLADGLTKVSTATGERREIQALKAHYASMNDEALFVIGENATKNLINDAAALCEIKERFKKAKSPLQGYANWQDFCTKNFTCSIRTVQNRIAAVTGKDTTKVNVLPGNKHTRSETQKEPIEVAHTVSAPVDVPDAKCYGCGGPPVEGKQCQSCIDVAIDAALNPTSYWQHAKMSEFEQKQADPSYYAEIVFRVKTKEDLEALAKATKQPLTQKTKSAWYPPEASPRFKKTSIQ
jgi:hypothetical protein